MITVEVAIGIHRVLIKKYGGLPGIRDHAALDSAIARPYQTFDGNELYKSSPQKAAAIIESIVRNHPFLDGNKRTGYVLMRLILMKDGRDIDSSEEDKYELVIKIASGQIDYKGIKAWIEDKMIMINKK